MSRKPSQSLVGRRIKLITCSDAWSCLLPGATGTVELVDDTGTVHVLWDSGERLGLVWDAGDRWSIV